jgi:hypothetical protein
MTAEELARRDPALGAAVPRYPDFFIVGAPRCGTTFMYEQLNRHPDIFMSPAKEPQFFATDLDSGSYLDSLTFMRDVDQYLALFAGARPDQITGEASTWYLYSSAAARNIKEANPAARIIIMLRDPVDMLYSLHQRRVYGGSEDIKNFEDALAAEDDRRNGRRIPPRARNIKALYYREVGRYADQVERYMETFGPDQVRVIIFEDMRVDPGAAYRDTLRFLGVDDSVLPTVAPVNESASRRFWRLQQLLLSPRVVRAARLVTPPRVRPWVGRTWDRINSRGTKRTALNSGVEEALRAELRPDVIHLGELLDRDLTAVWS